MPKKISGLNIIGATSKVDPIQNIISQIQSGFTGGYQTGQALGMKLIPKPTSQKVSTPKTYADKTDVNNRLLLSEVNKEINRHSGIVKNLEKDISSLESNINLPDVPRVFINKEDENAVINKFVEDYSTSKQKLTPDIVRELIKKDRITNGLIQQKRKKFDFYNQKLNDTLKQRDILKQRLGFSPTEKNQSSTQSKYQITSVGE